MHPVRQISVGFYATPKLKISEIAFAAGFQSLSQFNRIFKSFSGKSPTKFRAAEAYGSTPVGRPPTGEQRKT